MQIILAEILRSSEELIVMISVGLLDLHLMLFDQQLRHGVLQLRLYILSLLLLKLLAKKLKLKV